MSEIDREVKLWNVVKHEKCLCIYFDESVPWNSLYWGHIEYKKKNL